MTLLGSSMRALLSAAAASWASIRLSYQARRQQFIRKGELPHQVPRLLTEICNKDKQLLVHVRLLEPRLLTEICNKDKQLLVHVHLLQP